MTARESRDVVVVKFGGSVLRGPAGFTAAAQLAAEMATAGSRVVAVVSASFGQTDTLSAIASDLARRAQPDAQALDLLWSTGEHASVALLTLALHAAGIGAVPLSVHELGLSADDPDGLRLDPLHLRSALAGSQVVVVPGFLATRSGRVVTIGRGGSDLTAVTLAIGLVASACHLVKDVDGVFDADPSRHPHARLLPVLTYDTAIQLADAGSRVVQAHALRRARDAELAIVVRSLAHPGSRITHHLERHSTHGLLDSHDTCRAASRT